VTGARQLKNVYRTAPAPKAHVGRIVVVVF